MYIPLGLRYPDGTPLAEPLTESELVEQLATTADSVAAFARRVQQSQATFLELDEIAPANPAKPREAGWTIVVSADDPDAPERVRILKPLAEHWGMVDPANPLVFSGGDEASQANWIDEQYLGLGVDRPRYVLLAGDPVALPFALQSDLAAAGAAVGRVDFDSNDDLQSYVEKVLRLAAASSGTDRLAIVFATDGGIRDPTYYSCRYLADPIANQIEVNGRFDVRRLFGPKATRGALLELLKVSRPALVFTASHGFFAEPSGGIELQRRVNGAIECHRAGATSVDEWVVHADDLPIDRPFCPGAIVIQFACWSYGTPTDSSFTHWRVGKAKVTSPSPFVAAIPKRLLANPDGPIGFVGHVDTAWLHGFDDPARPIPKSAYHPRAAPFRTLVQRALLNLNPGAFGLEDLNRRSSVLSSNIATRFTRMRREQVDVKELPPNEVTKLVDLFTRFNDALNFLYFGDPGARVYVN